MNQPDASNQRGIELFNPNARVTELLENLGALHLFKVITGALAIPGDIETTRLNPPIQRTSRSTRNQSRSAPDAHGRAPDNGARFKDVTQFWPRI